MMDSDGRTEIGSPKIGGAFNFKSESTESLEAGPMVYGRIPRCGDCRDPCPRPANAECSRCKNFLCQIHTHWAYGNKYCSACKPSQQSSGCSEYTASEGSTGACLEPTTEGASLDFAPVTPGPGMTLSYRLAGCAYGNFGASPEPQPPVKRPRWKTGVFKTPLCQYVTRTGNKYRNKCGRKACRRCAECTSPRCALRRYCPNCR